MLIRKKSIFNQNSQLGKILSYIFYVRIALINKYLYNELGKASSQQSFLYHFKFIFQKIKIAFQIMENS